MNNIVYAEAKKIIETNPLFKNSEILSAMRLSDGFLFSMKPKNTEGVLDGFFKVTNTAKLEEYSPVMNPQEFKEAMKNIVYSKKG